MEARARLRLGYERGTLALGTTRYARQDHQAKYKSMSIAVARQGSRHRSRIPAQLQPQVGVQWYYHNGRINIISLIYIPPPSLCIAFTLGHIVYSNKDTFFGHINVIAYFLFYRLKYWFFFSNEYIVFYFINKKKHERKLPDKALTWTTDQKKKKCRIYFISLLKIKSSFNISFFKVE